MKKNKYKNNQSLSEYKTQMSAKTAAAEHESNLTLISVSLAIVAFFVMLYVNNAIDVNYPVAQNMIAALQWIFLAAAVVVAVFAIIRKKCFMWEYVVFMLLMAFGYYLLAHPGITAFPFLYEETETSFKVTSFGQKISKFLTTDYVKKGMWGLIVLYLVYGVAFHSIRYSLIKKGGSNKKGGKKN